MESYRQDDRNSSFPLQHPYIWPGSFPYCEQQPIASFDPLTRLYGQLPEWYQYNEFYDPVIDIQAIATAPWTAVYTDLPHYWIPEEGRDDHTHRVGSFPIPNATNSDASFGLMSSQPTTPAPPALTATRPSLPTYRTCVMPGGTPCHSRRLGGTIKEIEHHPHAHGIVAKRKAVVQCPWSGCPQRLQKENLSRHIRSLHLLVKVQCNRCQKKFTRKGALEKHMRKCTQRWAVGGVNWAAPVQA